jgi:hypothetical protein
MNMLGNNIIVIFDDSHNKVIGKGADNKPLLRADLWLNTEAEESDAPSRFDENENYLETHPQICTVVHPSANHDYKVGDKLFVHYMAWEWREYAEIGHIIETDYILFQILPDGTFIPAKDTYLGEPIHIKDEVEAGFVIAGTKKDSLRVKLTHLAPNNSLFEVGDVVVSIDKNNYEFDYWGKRYIKLTRLEMVSKLQTA